MKIWPLLLILFMPLALCAKKCIPDCDYRSGWTLEVRGAYYYPSSKDIRHKFSGTWLDYQVETSKRVHDMLEVWGGVNWAVKSGHTHSYHYEYKNRIRLSFVPISLGVKLMYPIFHCVDIYIGVGASYSFLEVKNRCKEYYLSGSSSTNSFHRLLHKNRFGHVLKVGFQYALCDSTFIDVFVDYCSQCFHFSHDKDWLMKNSRYLNFSGYKFGAGLGVYF